MPTTTHLTAGWLARVCHGPDAPTAPFRPDHDTRDWTAVTLPHQWAVSDGFAADSSRVAYRVQVPHLDLADGERAHVIADGVFYAANWWLDGVHLGLRDGYFTPQVLECSDVMRRGSGPQVLAALVDCPIETDQAHKSMVTGVFSHWDAIDTEFAPGGIWAPVSVVVRGPVVLHDAVALCAEATATRARVDVRLFADSTVDATCTVRLTLRDRGTGTEVAGMTRAWAVTPGTAHATFALHVADPNRWWPRRLGDAVLHDLTIELLGADGSVFDRLERPVGLRTITVEDWIVRVNGERLFIRGANYPPPRMALSQVTGDEVDADLRLAAEANLDLLRVHAHVSPDVVYDRADAAGMLLWQDFPLQWGYARSLRPSAERQAREMVRRLGSHPSIAMWCGHNEPLAVEITDVEEMSPVQAIKAAASMMLPTWNKDVLDPALRRAMTEEDHTRFVDEKSGELPNVVSKGTDTHMYFGWYFPGMRRFETLMQRLPITARFVSEFGAQSMPDLGAWSDIDPDAAANWPDLDWDRLARRHSLQPKLLDRWVPRADFDSLADYIAATQAYQGEILKYHIEVLRKRMWTPCGGFAMFQFQDAYPSITWSVVDHRREPKASFATLRDACADVLVMADWPAPAHKPNSPLGLRVWVVNDTRDPLGPVRIELELGDGRDEWRGEIDADCATEATTVGLAVPPSGPAELVLRLYVGDEADPISTNRYTVTVSG